MFVRLFLVASLFLSGFATPLAAKWRVAESDRFVIYAEDREDDIRRFADNLERYHQAMALITGREVPKPSPSNRVTIYVVGGQKEIRQLAGTKSRTVAGFYVPRAGGSIAFVQDIELRGRTTSWSMTVLLHEYAHHFLISSSRYAMPRWLSEGAAEFFASTKFEKNGGLSIGRPAIHRAGELAYAREVPVQQLLDPDLYAEKRGKRYDAFYGRSWLLYHFLHFSEERRGQLTAYQRGVATGTASIEAARQAFGDLDALETELEKYQKQRRLSGYTIGPEKFTMGTIAIRELSEGENEMMPLMIRSKRGVSTEQASEIVVKAREIAEQYPEDAGVLTALAEAEFDSENPDRAIIAADKAIAIDANRKNAYVQKGYALFSQAQDADDQKTAFGRAMKPFSALNQLENDHPLPLIYYYRSFIEQGINPPENAKHALERAAELAPFDKSLWYQVAMMQAFEGKTKLAMVFMAPVANDPHGSSLSDRASVMLNALTNAKDGEPFQPPVIIDVPDLPDLEDDS